jgi:hypothetical protein
VDLFCLEGKLRIGGHVHHEAHPDAMVEVQEILFFGHMFDALAPVFSARVLVSGDASDWTAPADIIG